MNGSTVVPTIAYAYNADNAVTSADDPDSSYAFTRDNLGRVTSLDNSGTPNMPDVVLSSQYDAMGDRTQLTATVAGTADFLNAYTYDADQNLLQATQEGQTGGNGVAPKGVGYAYNLDGQITSVLDFDPTTSSPHPDITYGTLSCDSGNRLTEINYTHSGTTLDDLSWSYDAANRVTCFTSSVDGTADYSYDPTNQLTAAAYTGTNQPANESYSFDNTGNRTNTRYTTGTNNQLTSDGTFDYTYDHEGNRVTRTRVSSGSADDYLTTYTWDYRNRLTDVNYYNNSSVLTKHIHYVYDVYDHLIGTEIDATTGSGSYSSSEWYALDIRADPNAPPLPVLQFDGNGNETYRFLNGPSAAGVDAVMAQEGITTQGSAGATDYMLADDLGSVRDIVNTSSAVDDHIVYNSFGEVAYQSNSAIAHWAGFAGYHTDANTGLDYADHRWYDPAVGRWISEDPLGFGGGDTNVNRYVGNASVNGVDPSGLARPPKPPAVPPAKPKPLTTPVTIPPGQHYNGGQFGPGGQPDIFQINANTWVVVGTDGLYHVYTNGVYVGSWPFIPQNGAGGVWQAQKGRPAIPVGVTVPKGGTAIGPKPPAGQAGGQGQGGQGQGGQGQGGQGQGKPHFAVIVTDNGIIIVVSNQEVDEESQHLEADTLEGEKPQPPAGGKPPKG